MAAASSRTATQNDLIVWCRCWRTSWTEHAGMVNIRRCAARDTSSEFFRFASPLVALSFGDVFKVEAFSGMSVGWRLLLFFAATSSCTSLPSDWAVSAEHECVVGYLTGQPLLERLRLRKFLETRFALVCFDICDFAHHVTCVPRDVRTGFGNIPPMCPFLK